MATVDANSSVTCHLPVSGIAITDAERVGMVELHWRNGTNTFVIERSNMKNSVSVNVIVITVVQIRHDL